MYLAPQWQYHLCPPTFRSSAMDISWVQRSARIRPLQPPGVVPALVGVALVVHVHRDVLVRVELVGVVGHRLVGELLLLVAFRLLLEGSEVVQAPFYEGGFLEQFLLGLSCRERGLLLEGGNLLHRLAFLCGLHLLLLRDLVVDLLEPVRHLLRSPCRALHVSLLFQDTSEGAI